MFAFVKEYIAAAFSLIILMITGLITLYAFFTKFNGELSGIHSNWGDFGSYISGTIGVIAACLAVIWLIISVTLQKKELASLKEQLEQSSSEQKNQTQISALTALINLRMQTITNYENDLVARKNGVELNFFQCEGVVRMSIMNEWTEIGFYERELVKHLDKKFVREEKSVFNEESLDAQDIPF